MVYLGYSLMCLIFGTTFLAIKWGIDAGLTPFLGGGIRFLLAGLVLLAFMAVRGQVSFSLLLRKEMLFTGLSLTFGTFSALYWAEQYLPSGMAAVLSATGPILVLILQALVLRVRASKNALWGCLLGFAGIVFLLMPGVSSLHGPFWLIASLVIIAGEVFYAGGTLYSKQVMPRFQGVSPIAQNAAQMMYGGAGLLILSLFAEKPNVQALLDVKALLSLLYLIVFGSMVAHSLYYWLIVKTTPLFPTTWLYISPVLALGFGLVLYGEPVTWNMTAGVLIVISGLLLINSQALLPMLFKKRNIPKSKPKPVHSEHI
ncbi:transporter [Paenibacillus yonginensis]|uniref:Transporter n=1 Tax=Paenibacillus yonginensis TaxID=1462996 RepID=A0A1B1MYU8_9BACL|nr:EamA family transporter [Paenibacillus yonginensis]ANS74362.1 transporter [Paenibacillus yonginensis]